MPAEPWPASLPTRFLVDSYAEDWPDGRLRSQMEAGPAKVRRRTSSAPGTIRGAFALTGAEVVTFRTFVGTQLIGGTLAFTFYDQVTGAAILCRFGERLPTVTPMDGIDLWRVEVELERLP